MKANLLLLLKKLGLVPAILRKASSLGKVNDYKSQVKSQNKEESDIVCYERGV